MGKFKDFLLTEEVGLGNLGYRLTHAFYSNELENKIKGAFPDNFVNGNTPLSGGKKLEIPSIERSGKITHLMKKKNPIYVRLSDGTECHFSYDEFRRIQGDPAIGKTMTVIFQRHPDDTSGHASKIDKVIVTD